MTNFSSGFRYMVFALLMSGAVAVSAQNAPIAINDTIVVPENTIVNASVSSNDSDIDGPAANYTLSTNPAHGTIVVSANGTYTYTPAANYNGRDSFHYSLCDGGTPNLCDTATVVITLTPVNNPPIIFNDFDTTAEELNLSGDVLIAGEIDPDGTGLIAGPVPVRDASHGSILVNTDGTFFYSPDVNFAGNDTVVISICDAGTPLPPICVNDTLIITVTPVNDAPVITNDAATTNEDTPTNGTILTTSDLDPDGTTLTATTTPVSGPSNGTILIAANGSYTYTPSADFNGSDMVVISVCDSGTPLPAICRNDTLRLTITPVNDAPLITNDVNTTNEDVSVNGNIITAGDTDPEGTALTASATLVTAPLHGTFFISANGNYAYIPAANYNGTETIVISVCDNGTPLPAQCSNDTLTITVLIINDAPLAVNDRDSTVENTALSGNASINDSDIDGPIVDYTIVSTPVSGTVALDPSGSYIYTPAIGFSGADTFSYSLCDGGTPVLCDTALVFITVDVLNHAPVAVNDTIITDEDTPVTSAVGGNDTDTDGPTAIFGIYEVPVNGTVTMGVNGVFTYTPAATYSGSDSFSYVHCDGGFPNLCDTATVYITVTMVNDAPVANDDNNTNIINTAITGTVKANDTDEDGPDAIYTVISPTSHGILNMTDSGTYVYTPSTDFTGCDSATISLCDAGTPNKCDTSLLVICTNPTNVPPVAQMDLATTTINVNVIINVLVNDSDANGNMNGAPTIANGPAHGTATVNTDGTITYSPASNFSGLDTFTYSICDSGIPVMCSTATVIVTVVAAPTIAAGPIVTEVDSTVTTCVAYTLSDYTSSLSTSISCTSGGGAASVTVDSVYHQLCIIYTPDSGYIGIDTFCVTLCESSTNLCTTATIGVRINSKNATCYWLKGISPNGDGQNDNFFINCNDSYPNASLKVFNRWGDQVWDSNGHYTNNFEGKNGRGEVLPDATYFYIYEFNDGTTGQHGGFIQVSR